MAIDDGRYLCCPLCQGKGQMHRSELIERLSDPAISREFRILLEQLKEEEAKSLVPTPNDHQDFEREVHSWPPRRILWRRSPKE
jgi:hypothetical protein